MDLASDLFRAKPEACETSVALSTSVGMPAGGEALRCEALRLVEEAENLGIPWRDVLKREIHAEGTLQRFLGDQVQDLPLWRALSIIPNSLFHSWRVRELIDRLCHEASAEKSRAARRELTSLLDCLSWPRARRVTEQMTLAKHYWFAYQRILELQTVALAAEECQSSGERCRMDVSESTGCSRRDAEWAVARLTSPSRSHALDDAVARVREEGFEIPGAATEIQAFTRLRRFLRSHQLACSSRFRGDRISIRTAMRAALKSSS